MKYIIEIPDERERDYIAETPFGKRLFFPLRITDVAYSLPTHLHVEEYTDVNREEIENEVWDFVKIAFWNMTQEDIDQCYDGWFPDSYREAEEKYDAWKKQKEEIRVGDEVTYGDANGVVVGIDTEDIGIYAVWKDGRTGYMGMRYVTKTGRHFDEVESLLKKMGGENE